MIILVQIDGSDQSDDIKRLICENLNLPRELVNVQLVKGINRQRYLINGTTQREFPINSIVAVEGDFLILCHKGDKTKILKKSDILNNKKDPLFIQGSYIARMAGNYGTKDDPAFLQYHLKKAFNYIVKESEINVEDYVLKISFDGYYLAMFANSDLIFDPDIGIVEATASGHHNVLLSKEMLLMCNSDNQLKTFIILHPVKGVVDSYDTFDEATACAKRLASELPYEKKVLVVRALAEVHKELPPVTVTVLPFDKNPA